jgi:hypothetical protein
VSEQPATYIVHYQLRRQADIRRKLQEIARQLDWVASDVNESPLEKVTPITLQGIDAAVERLGVLRGMILKEQ